VQSPAASPAAVTVSAYDGEVVNVEIKAAKDKTTAHLPIDFIGRL
jgi:hypothetical protein